MNKITRKEAEGMIRETIKGYEENKMKVTFFPEPIHAVEYDLIKKWMREGKIKSKFEECLEKARRFDYRAYTINSEADNISAVRDLYEQAIKYLLEDMRNVMAGIIVGKKGIKKLNFEDVIRDVSNLCSKDEAKKVIAILNNHVEEV